ncbi:hypothetical protein GALMADRAFT_143881 [Galerina marginata CBS 339.88]|uniref:Uncharacterized protein n=1 Tax=Galerina marginata (strain CBS 339.88) TaxID=685588 RepID=A0A067SXZ1_GALM3|nr:hypothetical protein GALMADRAFT_143881 [Galerina marginata CBS 339.88]
MIPFVTFAALFLALVSQGFGLPYSAVPPPTGATIYRSGGTSNGGFDIGNFGNENTGTNKVSGSSGKNFGFSGNNIASAFSGSDLSNVLSGNSGTISFRK